MTPRDKDTCIIINTGNSPCELNGKEFVICKMDVIPWRRETLTCLPVLPYGTRAWPSRSSSPWGLSHDRTPTSSSSRRGLPFGWHACLFRWPSSTLTASPCWFVGLSHIFDHEGWRSTTPCLPHMPSLYMRSNSWAYHLQYDDEWMKLDSKMIAHYL